MPSSTQKVYAYAVAKFAKFHPPAQVRSWHLFPVDALWDGRITPKADQAGNGEIVESPGGVSPPGAPKTVHDPLESHGSRCSAVAMA